MQAVTPEEECGGVTLGPYVVGMCEALPGGYSSRPRPAARFLRLRTRHRHAATAELRLVHLVEAEAVVEQHLALGGVGNVLPTEQRRDGPGIRIAVVARLADEQRVEVEIVGGEDHRVFP